MDYTYGFPLYTSKEVEKAFNYLQHSEDDNDKIKDEDKVVYDYMTYSKDNKLKLVVTSNSKKVQNILVDKLLPEFSIILKTIGQKHGFVTFNPEPIILSFNPFFAQTIDKCMPYISSDMRSMSNIWIYFEGFINRDLEQIIKLKYSEYLLIDNNKVYVKLSPDENFSFIYDFIDDVLSHS